MALYNSTNGGSWFNSTGWSSTQPLDDWYGVDMNSNGCVIELALQNNNLVGSIPPEIGSLSSLTQLNLRENNLSGSIPPSINNLTDLENIAMRLTNLSGAVPSINNLTNLETLSLVENHFSSLPASMCSNKPNLTIVYFSYNDLTVNDCNVYDDCFNALTVPPGIFDHSPQNSPDNFNFSNCP